MKMKKLLCRVLFICVLPFMFSGVVDSQAEIRHVDSIEDETYERVLEQIFPRSDLNGVTGFCFIVRFRRSFGAESQIILQYREGVSKITEYRSMDGNVYLKLHEIVSKTGNERIDFLSKGIKVEKRQFDVSILELKIWREKYLRALIKASERVLVKSDDILNEINQIDDGTIYEIWYRESSETYHRLSEIGHSGRRIGDDPLVKWAKELNAKMSLQK